MKRDKKKKKKEEARRELDSDREMSEDEIARKKQDRFKNKI
jgi:hypothetical protein